MNLGVSYSKCKKNPNLTEQIGSDSSTSNGGDIYMASEVTFFSKSQRF